jgi:hypothetical protein
LKIVSRAAGRKLKVEEHKSRKVEEWKSGIVEEKNS